MGLRVATLTIQSDDPETPSYSFTVQGVGMRSEGANIAMSFTQNRGLVINRLLTMTVTLQNQGPGNAGGTRVLIPRPTSGVTSFTWQCQAVNGAVCPAPSGALTTFGRTSTLPGLDQTIAVFPIGGKLTYTVLMNLTEVLTSVNTQIVVETPEGVKNLNPVNTLALGSYIQLLPMMYR